MQRNKKHINSLLIVGQVIVHHNHNLLIWDAVLVDDLIGVTRIGLREAESIKTNGVSATSRQAGKLLEKNAERG